ncbi:hypothetical protein DFH06DRAFT_313687 [Mycena polygramma]|nr:hypothetical protein DFH06DRAFT_313687 [Mycena polygramma]
MFAVKHNGVTLLEFTAPFSLFQSTTMNRPPSPPIPTMSHRAPTTKRVTPGLTPLTQHRLEQSRFAQMARELGEDQVDQVFEDYPIEQREAFALGLIDSTDPLVEMLQGSFRDGKPFDIAEMPRTGDPAATKITTIPIPQTRWVVRQFPIDIHSPAEAAERQAFLYDLYDSSEGKQLHELPHGYSFESVSIPPTGGSLQLVPVTLSSPYYTTAGIRGVMFAVKHNRVTLLEFTAPF